MFVAAKHGAFGAANESMETSGEQWHVSAVLLKVLTSNYLV